MTYIVFFFTMVVVGLVSNNMTAGGIAGIVAALATSVIVRTLGESSSPSIEPSNPHPKNSPSQKQAQNKQYIFTGEGYLTGKAIAEIIVDQRNAGFTSTEERDAVHGAGIDKDLYLNEIACLKAYICQAIFKQLDESKDHHIPFIELWDGFNTSLLAGLRLHGIQNNFLMKRSKAYTEAEQASGQGALGGAAFVLADFLSEGVPNGPVSAIALAVSHVHIEMGQKLALGALSMHITAVDK
jgi:hypothetical protein